MDPKFAALVETLAPKLQALVAMKPLRYGQLPMNMPAKGVYLFSEGSDHLYVGRSNVLRKRYHRHFASHRSAAFAFLLARKETGRTVATYRMGDGSREDLMQDPVFKAAFVSVKTRMREMDYRYVEEIDQNKQALLEIYCAIVLGTPHNDFGTH